MKIRIDNKPALLRSLDYATCLAAELQTGDPDWTYTIVDVGNDRGLVRIDCFDEDGDFVASV